MSPTELKLPQGFVVKDVYASSGGYLLTSIDGKLYGLGVKKQLGVNNSSSEYVQELTLIDNMNSCSFFNDVLLNNYGGSKICVVLRNNKIYMTGNQSIMFGNEILEKNWTKVASDVGFFNGYGNCFVDSSNNLWMSGDSRRMGLGKESEVYKNIPNYVQITDSSINGKVKKCWQKGDVTYVLLNNNELWATGLYESDAKKIEYPGWRDELNRTNFVEILDDVSMFEITGAENGDTNVKFASTGDGKFYTWGQIFGGTTGDGLNGDNSKNVPTVINLNQEIFNISYFSFLNGLRSCILLKDGSLFCSGAWGEGWTGGWKTTLTYQKFDLPYVDGEIATKVVSCDSTSALFLTDKGGVLGYGPSSLLGKGSFSTTLEPIQDISSLRSYNICDVTAGDGYYIAITTDGKVLGTGSNQSGVLGRWIGIDRTSPDSRYKTANQWVECPELEL